MVTTQRPSTAGRVSRPSSGTAKTGRNTAGETNTAAHDRRATAAGEKSQRQTRVAGGAAAEPRRRPSRKATTEKAVAQAPAEVDAGGMRWTTVSVPVIHAQLPVPTWGMPVRPPSVPDVKAVTARPRPVAHALKAAEQATRRNMTKVTLPVVGEVHLPAGEELVFLGGVVALTAFGILEWPVALLLGAGHTLAGSRRNKVVRAFGEALEEV